MNDEKVLERSMMKLLKHICDLMPSDCYLFRSLDKLIHGVNLNNLKVYKKQLDPYGKCVTTGTITELYAKRTDLGTFGPRSFKPVQKFLNSENFPHEMRIP